MATDVRVVQLTVPDESTGRALCRAVVAERLAACAQLGGTIESWYRWEGELRQEREWTVTIKTVLGCVEPLLARLVELHPYEVPELLVLAPEGGAEAYLGWVERSCEPSP
jgi:periplasmic divalent cation tolerance protein